MARNQPTATAASPRLKSHPFVSAITKKTGAQPKVKMIRGYVGESPEKDHVRIYLDIELRRFLDVPASGVVHSETIPETVMPLGATYVWVREDARVLHRGSLAAPEDPTTMATGEEGGGNPTTMATGEEALGFENPLDLVMNPFGRF